MSKNAMARCESEAVAKSGLVPQPQTVDQRVSVYNGAIREPARKPAAQECKPRARQSFICRCSKSLVHSVERQQSSLTLTRQGAGLGRAFLARYPPENNFLNHAVTLQSDHGSLENDHLRAASQLRASSLSLSTPPTLLDPRTILAPRLLTTAATHGYLRQSALATAQVQAQSDEGSDCLSDDGDTNDVRHVMFQTWVVGLHKLSGAKKRAIGKLLRGGGAEVGFVIGDRTTHVVSTHTTLPRAFQMRRDLAIVSPDFILQCVRAGKILPLPEMAGAGSTGGMATGRIGNAEDRASESLSCELLPTTAFALVEYEPLPGVRAEVVRYFLLASSATERYACVELQVIGETHAFRVVVHEGSTLTGIKDPIENGVGSITLFDWAEDAPADSSDPNSHRPAVFAVPIAKEATAANAEGVLNIIVNSYEARGYCRVEIDAVGAQVGSAELAELDTVGINNSVGKKGLVGRLVQLLYDEAKTSLNTSIDFKLGQISSGQVCSNLYHPPLAVFHRKTCVAQVETAEAILIEIHRIIRNGSAKGATSKLEELSHKFFSTLPFQSDALCISSPTAVARYQRVCQTIRDLLPSSEAGAVAARSGSTGAMLAALHCDITPLEPDSAAFDALRRQVAANNETVEVNRKIRIRTVFVLTSNSVRFEGVCNADIILRYAVKRPVEMGTFRSLNVKNRKQLFHATRASSLFGILSQVCRVTTDGSLVPSLTQCLS